MNRDNLMFLVIGSLCGFILGYVLHEVMAARQPAPLWAGDGARQQQAGAPAAPPAGGAQAPGQSQAGQTAAMEQVQQLRAHVAANPDDSQAVRQLANLNYDIGNWRRAADLYEQYLGLVPGEPDVMTDLGACYRNLGNFQEALGMFRQVRESSPDHWQSIYNEVLVLAFDLQELEAAQGLLQRLVDLQPGNPDVERLATEVAKRLDAA